ncbi:MAG: ergothioneine biosynthesis protein EgtB [Proteobacteria bacterium]|nr:ergothioneine biosynthesis protein EgtB [Pseudomonadota bacterium]
MDIDPSILAAGLIASRARSARITADLDGERLLGPKLRIVNPPLWEVGHVAWFQEFWCLRHRGDGAPRDSILPGADALYDSARVAHDTRWTLPLPSLDATRSYLAGVLALVLRRLEREGGDADLRYFVQLATFHEDMHAEAFHYTRQTVGYPDPFPQSDSMPPAEGASGDAALEGGRFLLGASPGGGFVFDNEKWAHEVQVAPFSIARSAVTNAQYLAFVESGGYGRREYWDDAGWAWRESAVMQSPRHWVKQDGSWRLRRFDQVLPLPAEHPVLHVNWHEAQAYCRFAQRRLPTEIEWEYAASFGAPGAGKRRYPWGDAAPTAAHANLEGNGTAPVGAYPHGDTASGCRQMIGNVWEWTASAFEPYPGYVVDPYKEYSQPWFGTHKVLRGGSFASSRALLRNTWRNFYTPDRGDIFAGFRTCAKD